MSWNYRLVRRVEDGREYFAVHEAFYDDAGRVWSITEVPVAASGDSRAEALTSLTDMLRDCESAPVIEWDDVPEPGAVNPRDRAGK